jgi:hypothetical protein
MSVDQAYAKVLERNKELIFELKSGRINTNDLPLIIKGLQLVEVLLKDNLELRKKMPETKTEEENPY